MPTDIAATPKDAALPRGCRQPLQEQGFPQTPAKPLQAPPGLLDTPNTLCHLSLIRF